MASLAGASPKVGPYPFTTQLPQAAMMPFENVQVQLVDLPPVVEEGTPGWMRPVLRYADLLMLVVDLSQDSLSEIESVERELEVMRIAAAPDVDAADPEDVTVWKSAVVVGNKRDEGDAGENFALLEMDLAGRLPSIAVSATSGTGLEDLKRLLFERLGVIRVYTKPPGKDANLAEPTVLKRGSTIDDLAILIHKDIREKLRYAVLWGSGRFQRPTSGEAVHPGGWRRRRADSVRRNIRASPQWCSRLVGSRFRCHPERSEGSPAACHPER